MPSLPLILASSSPARRELLQRLNIPFACASPDIDESRLPGESAPDMARRLSEAKARASHHPAALIIGSDQTLQFREEILGKPGSHERAREQLMLLSGQEATFQTGLCLLNTASGTCHLTVETFSVKFRPLASDAIERYLRADRPYGCAGSFKSESLGIALFERFQGRDPTSLIGLPLMALVEMLAREKMAIP